MSEKVATKAAKKETKVRKLDEESEDSAPEVKKGRGRPKKDPSETKVDIVELLAFASFNF